MTGTATPGLGIAIGRRRPEHHRIQLPVQDGRLRANIGGTNDRFDYNEIYERTTIPIPGAAARAGANGGGRSTPTSSTTRSLTTAPAKGSPVSGWTTATRGRSSQATTSPGLRLGDHRRDRLRPATSPATCSWTAAGEAATAACGSNCDGTVNLNSSGGFNVPGSRYQNSVLVSGNQFVNDWMASISGRPAPVVRELGRGLARDRRVVLLGRLPQHRVGRLGGRTVLLLALKATTASRQPRPSRRPRQASAAQHDDRGRGPRRSATRSASAIPLEQRPPARPDVADLQGPGDHSGQHGGFPASGQLRVGTSAAWGRRRSYTGAILSYTGTPHGFTGRHRWSAAPARWPARSGRSSPIKVTAEKCYANDCDLDLSPPLASPEAAGAGVSNAGTCQLYATSAALPSGPLAPDDVSYWDGCQWEAKDISVTGNNFVFQPSVIAGNGPLPGGGTTTCTAAHADNCGTNFMAVPGRRRGAVRLADSRQRDDEQVVARRLPAWDQGCSADPLANLNASSARRERHTVTERRPATPYGPAIPTADPGAGPPTSSVPAARCPPTRQPATPCRHPPARQTSASGSRCGARTPIQRPSRRYQGAGGASTVRMKRERTLINGNPS